LVKLLLGRGGAGKSAAILRRIAGGGPRPQLLIVPEQASHETERRLCAMGGNQVSRYAEVLSFTRLAGRVLTQAGGLARPTLDAGGRLILMRQAVRQVADALTLYAASAQKPAFLHQLLSTLDECKRYTVTPQALGEAAADLEGPEGEKLRELSLILGAYVALQSRVAADPQDGLTRLAQGLKEAGYARGMDIYLDGFLEFTPQQLLVLRELIAQGESVTVALTCDSLESDEGVFASARYTAHRVIQCAQEAHKRVEVERLPMTKGWKAEPLYRVEENLFSQDFTPWDGPAPEVVLRRAFTPRSEVEWVAAQTVELVREGGLRWRDVAVAARNFDGYAHLVEEVFPRYGIPVFLNEMTDILQKPVLTLVTAALDTVAGGYAYEDLFRYLKTDLTGLARAERDELENYAILWDLKEGHWTGNRDWTMSPQGYGFPADPQTLERLNGLRRRVAEPLVKLARNPNETGRGQAIALYTFLEDIGLPKRLEERCAALVERGELKRAEEDRQLWEILTGALEQCARILDDTPMGLAEFGRLLKLILSQYDVGAIPVSLDRVNAGDAQRLGNREVKALFFLGCDDAAIPQAPATPGLFTDEDRSFLASYGLELSPPQADRLDREWTIVYDACVRPSQRLTVSWAAMGAQGEERRPSSFVERLRLLFPWNEISQEGGDRAAFRLAAPRAALEVAGQEPQAERALRALPAYAPLVERMDRAATARRGSLSPQAVRNLYGERVPMSASRMDKYKSCHFAYFMDYGLKAKPRARAGFLAPEYGTFVHYVLEHILQDKELVKEGQAPVREALNRAIAAVFDQYISEELGGLENKSKRFLYLFDRLKKPVAEVVENVLEELARSQFRPIAFELGFGDKGDLPPVELTVDGVTVSVSGFVDRVDGWVKDGRLYLRVVDYKTGRKSFDLTEIWNGLGLQMLLYLFTLEDKGMPGYEDLTVTPAGVLYLPARDVVLSGSRAMDEASRRAAVDKELTRKGLILDDAQVLAAMEAPEGDVPRFLPVKVSARSGEITGEALVTAQRLGRLKTHTQHILRQIGQELAKGVVTADPYWRDPAKNACAFCDYAAACHFEEGRGGDKYRYFTPLKGEEFWSALEEET